MPSVALRCLPFLFCTFLAGCITIVSNYDPVVDAQLNQFSENTAKFLAAAKAGGSQRNFKSKEATEYYAVAFNTTDLLANRMKANRGLVACPGASKLMEARAGELTPPTTLPNDYQSFDCKEFEVFILRTDIEVLQNDHRDDGILSKPDIDISGKLLQYGIQSTINTVVLNKPPAKS